jgi:predicted nucleotidyltransferase
VSFATAFAKIAEDLVVEAEAAEQLRGAVLPAVALGVEEARNAGLCRRAWLFGSFSWGTPVERSDVDLLSRVLRIRWWWRPSSVPLANERST